MLGSSHRAGQRQPCQDLGLAPPSRSLAALHTPSKGRRQHLGRELRVPIAPAAVSRAQTRRGAHTGHPGGEADMGGPGEISLYLEGPWGPGRQPERPGLEPARGNSGGWGRTCRQVPGLAEQRPHPPVTPACPASSCRLGPALNWGSLCGTPVCSPSRKPRLPRHVQEQS